MTTLSARRLGDLRNTVNESKLTWLGSIGADDFATYAGAEYLVDRHPTPDPAVLTRADTEILVRKVTVEDVDGSQLENHRLHRAHLVRTGTFAALKAKRDKRAAPKLRVRVWDVLGSLPVMRRREPNRLPTEPPSSFLAGVLKAQRGKGKPLPILEVGGHEPPERSPAGIIAYLKGRGVTLRLARGRLVAESSTPIKFDDRALYKEAGELIVGHLKGQPVMCSDCQEPAVTVVDANAPMCAEHAGD